MSRPLRLFCFVLAASMLTACRPSIEASFNREVIDFGTGSWAGGAPTESESVYLVNDGGSAVFLHALGVEGEAGESFSVATARELELPHQLSAGVGSELVVTFVGSPDEGQEVFDSVLFAELGTQDSRGHRVEFTVPVTLELVCDLDEDGDPTPECGGGDCDDGDASRASTFEEICNGVDDDCNAVADADLDGEQDFDLDGFLSCEDCNEGSVYDFPGAEERCDGLDNDCNGAADFDAEGEVDADGDEWLSCEDCDDSDASIGPFECL